jgi:hypothetical protein
METYTVLAEETATAKLSDFREWLNRNRDNGIVVIAFRGGLTLVGKGTDQLLH